MFQFLKWFSKKEDKNSKGSHNDRTLREMKAEKRQLKNRLEALQEIEEKLKEAIK
ncbi:hypothetical protein [Aquimarina sp. MMG016]|uniref:hypothetical protein n=1 Tax=Aquimarina sp. MMG016 TaxID=2822690 RepID=UPI001B3A3DDA|nr:hypothetical protein [Aquimarina sp. MMG016]MBQ4821718.1 hypothetical protein [Aquimarina sp. MMG016]